MSDPAFLMFPKDWLSGTGEMSHAAKGVFIDLLCYQHQNEGIPPQPEKIARIAGMSLAEFKPVWEELSGKFSAKENGRLFNGRLDREVDRRKEFSHKKAIFGIMGAFIKRLDAPESVLAEIKKQFDYQLFINTPKDELQDKVIDQLKLMLKHISGTATASVTGTATETFEKGGVGEKTLNRKKFEKEIRVIEYYNQATGRKASTTAMSNIKPIAARLKEGFSEQDLFDIVDFKQVEWTGTEMEKHLVIETLYGNKAEKYRTQVQNAKDKGLTAAQIKGKPNGNGVDHTNLKAEALAAGFKMFKK